MKVRRVVFPGSFDPFTLGHFSVVDKATKLFDEIIIGIGVNSTKNYCFDLEQRIEWINNIYANQSNVSVKTFNGLTVDFCSQNNCQFILRGLRNENDFQYESNIAHMNKALNQEIETVFILCNPEYGAINSSIVREIYKNGGNVDQFLPYKLSI